MRITVTLLLLLLSLTQIRAQALTDKAREELMSIISKLEEEAKETTDQRFRTAITAYRKAIKDPDDALDLYLNCVEKVRFEDKRKDPRDFRNWKEREEQNLSSESFKLALTYQLKWLMLSLEASSQDPDRDKLALNAQQIISSIFDNIDKVAYQGKILKQPVASTVFAQAYQVNGIDPKWPQSPTSIDAIYEQVILPPLRTATRSQAHQAAWINRIQMLESNTIRWASGQEFVVDGKGRRDRERERELRKKQEDEQSIAVEIFNRDVRPQLIWNMEKELFQYGDQSTTALRMVKHLRKNLRHKSAAKWTEEFKDLLAPPEEKSTIEP